MIKRSPTILHIDDDQVDCLVIRKLLKNQGLAENVRQLHNGEEALHFLQELIESRTQLPDILLLDINMPRMNGLELLRAIRSDERLRHLPVFILTTSDDEDDRHCAFQLNVAGYFLKGLDMSDQEMTIGILTSYWDLNRFPD